MFLNRVVYRIITVPSRAVAEPNGNMAYNQQVVRAISFRVKGKASGESERWCCGVAKCMVYAAGTSDAVVLF